MKRKTIWLVVSCLMVAALVLASCGPAAVEEEEVVTPEEEEEVVTEEEVVVTEEKEMVRDSLGRLVEKPRYGGVAVYTGSTQTGFDEAYTPSYSVTSMRFTNDELEIGDWVRGPVGTGEVMWRGNQFYWNYSTGCVAESWEIVDDKTARFKIRKGIHFALNPDSEASRLVGGRELNAHDVAYSISRSFFSPGCYMQLVHTTKEKEGFAVWAEDDWTVMIQWKPEMARVVGEFREFCGIIAPEVIEKYGDMKDWRLSHGTGPFIIVDNVPMSSTTYVRNPNYWRKHPLYPEDTMPYLDGIKMLVISDLSTRVSAMRTGKIDVLSLDWEETGALMETNPELEHMGYVTSSRSVDLVMNNPDLPWYDERVRRALSLALDQPAILDDLYGGHGQVLAFPVVPWPQYMDMYTPLEELPESTQELFEYHPDKAKQLLAEAGYPDGFQARVLCSSAYVDDLSVIKAYWEKIGVDLKIDVRDAAVVTSMLNRKKQEQMYYPGRASLANIPVKFSIFYTVGFQNYNRRIDPRWEEAAKAMDALGWETYTEYSKILKPVFQYILEQAWSIVLPGKNTYKFWQPWLKDYHGDNGIGWLNGSNWLNFIWLGQELKEEMTGKR